MRPSGTVTFLFTDIEGSTRRWEADPASMRAALALHDDAMHSAVEAHGGWLFKHTGDGVCAAFGSARAAIDAAVAAQLTVGLPVRMGIATGEAECRGNDYFGPVLNRTARVMAAGHGGQIVVAASTAAVVSGVELVDRGEHRLRDLSGVERLYQVRAPGLADGFPPLRTLDATPGNLPMMATSFVGRDDAVKTLCDLVRDKRLVTLTGVGGVGKTRLAVQAAAQLTGAFDDGVWLVELAPVGDPAAVPDAVAVVLGVTPQADRSVTASITTALAGRRLLVVLDNCEHVLDAAGELVEQLLARTATVKVIATSREGLRINGEQLFPVVPLDVSAGTESAAVGLFVDRARAVNPDVAIHDEVDAAAVVEICRQLDGIALAIELAAARTISMSVGDVRDRLTDRFRLLSGAGRASRHHHQTLREMVSWSFDLLGAGERRVLGRCSVFAGGFDLAAAAAVGEHGDEYELLDVLDSLVRKSLLVTEHVRGHVRYDMLGTIRQFAAEQLEATGDGDHLRDRHAAYFADQAITQWQRSEGPGYRAATAWLETELANLRAGFRWATDHTDTTRATAIAAHATMLGFHLQLFEPIGWVEETLPAAVAAHLPRLPRLYTAASLCCYVGRPERAVTYAADALALQSDQRYDPFDEAFCLFWSAAVHVIADGDLDTFLDICADLARRPGLGRVIGLSILLFMLPAAGRIDDARGIAVDGLAVARDHGNPVWIMFALIGTGRTFASSEPDRALAAFREALDIAQQQSLPWFVAQVASQGAGLETLHGDPDLGLELFDTAIDAYQRASNHVDLAAALAALAVFFDRNDQPDVAATIYGIKTQYAATAVWVVDFTAAIDHIRAALGDAAFQHRVAAGAAMETGAAIRYARDQIQVARAQS